MENEVKRAQKNGRQDHEQDHDKRKANGLLAGGPRYLAQFGLCFLEVANDPIATSGASGFNSRFCHLATPGMPAVCLHFKTPSRRCLALWFIAGEAGLEPATYGFGDRCSAKLSYSPESDNLRLYYLKLPKLTLTHPVPLCGSLRLPM